MKAKRYTCRYVKRGGSGEQRSFTVYAYSLLDADLEGMKKIEALEGDRWRETWWSVGAQRESA